MVRTKNLIPSSELRAELERRATVVFKPKGTILFRRGDNASGVFLILRGQIRLGLDFETPVYPDKSLGAGMVAGLPGTVSGKPYSLTAKVVEDAELAFVPRKAVLACFQESPLLCFQALHMISGEIADVRTAFKKSGSCLGAGA